MFQISYEGKDGELDCIKKLFMGCLIERHKIIALA